MAESAKYELSRTWSKKENYATYHINEYYSNSFLRKQKYYASETFVTFGPFSDSAFVLHNEKNIRLTKQITNIQFEIQ